MFLAAIQHLASLDPQPNLIILSGDFVDTGIEAEYALAAEMLASIPQTILMIPGNHDDRERFGLASAITLTLPVQGLCISPLVAKPSFVCIRLN